MNVLIIGSGGREHALAWKIAQSKQVDDVFVAPGNAGTDEDAQNVDIAGDDFVGLTDFARKNDVQLTVVGPEMPLCNGIVDAFQSEGLRIFGPSRSAAQLEGSKVFCKTTLRGANVPTADFHVFRDATSAEHFIRERYPEPDDPVPVVIKADGLAAGKGAIVCGSRGEALEAIDRIARRREFGGAGNQLIVEERLEGQEASVLAITDGRTVITMPAAQDHKARLRWGYWPQYGRDGGLLSGSHRRRKTDGLD